jgi:hypothetical protein
MVNLRHPLPRNCTHPSSAVHRYLNTDFDQTITETTLLRTTRKAETCDCGA